MRKCLLKSYFHGVKETIKMAGGKKSKNRIDTSVLGTLGLKIGKDSEVECQKRVKSASCSLLSYV